MWVLGIEPRSSGTELIFLSAEPALQLGNYSGPINTAGEFEVIDSEKIFSEALVNRIVNYNLFDLKFTDAGFVLGGNGAPNITFDIDDDGILGIIGINSAPANDSTKD